MPVLLKPDIAILHSRIELPNFKSVRSLAYNTFAF